MNEGGHVRYLKLLAILIPWKIFVVHLRILEDCIENRLSNSPRNVRYITISSFMSSKLRGKHEIILDPYPWKDTLLQRPDITDAVKLGIVGRICSSKGLKYILDFIEYMNHKGHLDSTSIHFYGDESTSMEDQILINRIKTINPVSIHFHGFIPWDKIREQINILTHFNTEEPLGRIMLDAIDSHLPFIGLKGGGVSEIAQLARMENRLIDSSETDAHEKFWHLIQSIQTDYAQEIELMKHAKKLVQPIFNVHKYTDQVEHILFTN